MNAQTFSHEILKTRNLMYLLLITLLLSACGSCPKPAQPLPDGAYITTVTVADMTDIGMTQAISCENAGTFILTVTGKKWSFFQTAAPGCIVKNPSWSGTWKFCGDEATFTDNGSSYTYKWAFDGAELRFTRVNDTTATRIVWMTNYPWVLQK
jgi:hypothetical protein